MQRSLVVFSFVASYLATGLLSAQSTKAPVKSTLLEEQQLLIKIGRDNNQVMNHLDHLTNKIGPRLSSSDQLQTACEWAVEQFKKFGIDNARLEEWGEFPVGFTRGTMKGRMTAPEEIVFELTTPSWTGGTDGALSGPAMLAPATVEEAEKVKEQLKGKWLVAATGGARGSAVPRDQREALAKIYAEAGILGQVRPGQAQGNLVHTGGNFNITWETRPMTPSVIIRFDQWQKVVEHIKAEKEVTLEFHLENKWRQGPIKLYNVVADIVGTEFPDEYVIVGGHIDSWDGATGTTDNGTGVSTTLEAARILASSGLKPRRTIRFMLWSGEEQGLLGSWGWIGKNKDVLPKISAVLVHDGGTNYVSGIVATKAMMSEFENVFAFAKDLDKEMPFELKETSALPEGIGSDHDSFLREGVPGFFWSQDGKAVYSVTHHTQNDKYEAAIEPYQKHTSMVVACGAWGIASLDKLLDRSNMKGRQFGVRVDMEGVVTEVVPESAASRVGIKSGDKLVSFDGVEIKNNRDLRAQIRKAGDTVKVVIQRGAETLEMSADLR